jgi:hypothetical protein
MIAGSLGIIALALFLYGIFLLEAVAHTAARAEAERDARQLSANLSSLEMAYLSATRTVTPERAAGLGFVPLKEVSIVYAGTQTLSLSLDRPQGAYERP